MQFDEFYRILGRLTYSYTMIDFLCSHMAVDLGIVKTPYEFFSITGFEKKINKLKSKIQNVKNKEFKSDFINWLDKLDELRQKRNTIIHSVILNNSKDENEFKLFNYRNNRKQLTREIYDYTADDLRKIDQELVNIHKIGYELRKKMTSD